MTFGTEYGLSAGVYSPNVLGNSFTLSPLNRSGDAARLPCLLPRFSRGEDLIECGRVITLMRLGLQNDHVYNILSLCYHRSKRLSALSLSLSSTCQDAALPRVVDSCERIRYQTVRPIFRPAAHPWGSLSLVLHVQAPLS
jgi:hypothetical protein